QPGPACREEVTDGAGSAPVAHRHQRYHGQDNYVHRDGDRQADREPRPHPEPARPAGTVRAGVAGQEWQRDENEYQEIVGRKRQDVPQAVVDGREGRAAGPGRRHVYRLADHRPDVPAQGAVEKELPERQVPDVRATAPVARVAEYRRDLVPQHYPEHERPDGHATEPQAARGRGEVPPGHALVVGLDIIPRRLRGPAGTRSLPPRARPPCPERAILGEEPQPALGLARRRLQPSRQQRQELPLGWVDGWHELAQQA